MKVKQITFTAPGVAELWEVDGPDAPGRGEVLVKTAYTAVSAGTERANLMGEYRTNINEKYCGLPFPKVLGYSSAGEVVAVGEGVKSVKVGDRVQMFWTTHRSYLCKSEDQVVKIPDGVSYKEATMAFIASFALAGVRKTAWNSENPPLLWGLASSASTQCRFAVPRALCP